jgi:hypothetical protein
MAFAPVAGASTPTNLPYLSLGKLFMGREPFLTILRETLIGAPSHTAALVPKTAIHGLGGVGKTRLAVEYAWRYADNYTALLFVTADTPGHLRRNLAALVEPLVLNLPEQQVPEEDVQIAAALRWLEEHPGWLLIVDNVDTEEAARELEAHLTRLRGGHVLITARLSSWSPWVKPLKMDTLDEDAAVAFLLERTQGRRREMASDNADAHALARELDGLALALVQAGAYIEVTGITVAEYLNQFSAQHQELLRWGTPSTDYPDTVATTWKLTFQRVQQESPTAAALLHLCAFLAPDEIPIELFRNAAAIRSVHQLMQPLQWQTICSDG